jgi:hypothetical protein
MRNSSFSMECLDTHNNSKSHLAANIGQCTQTAVRTAVTCVCHLPLLTFAPLLYL